MIAEKAQTLAAISEAGIDLMRQNLKRRYPAATEEEIDRHLQIWLETRPGAEQGDCPGRPYTFKFIKR